MVLAWENLQEVFVMLVVAVVFLTGGFYISGLLFLATGTPPWLLSRWRPPLALSSTLVTFSCFKFARPFRHSFTASATVLSGCFLPADVFYLMLLHRHFWHGFVTQLWAGTPHPGSSSVSALTDLSFPADAWTWTTHIVVTRRLIYQLRQWATKYKVKIELPNMFHLFKVIWKNYKNTLNRTWQKILLKTASTKLHIKAIFLKKPATRKAAKRHRK